MTTLDPTSCEFLRMNEEILEDPYPFYKVLRDEHPVFREPEYGVYIISRYDEVQHVLAHPEVFSSVVQGRGPYMPLPAPLDEIREWRRKDPYGEKLITNDPPEHTRYRALINRFFTPKRVAALEPTIKEHANSLIDTFISAGETDFVSEFADILPRIVVGELIGVPRADIDRFTEMFKPRVRDMAEAAKDPVAVFRGILDQADGHNPDFLFIGEYVPPLAEYFFNAVAEREANPCDDIMSRLVHGHFSDGEDVPLEIVPLMALTLYVGGADGNTPTMLTESMLLLAQHPELQKELRGSPDAIDTFIDEVLRYEAPVQGIFRTALIDTDLGGVQIPKGSHVMLLFASANRDEACFTDGDRFDPHRANKKSHFSFAQGAHFCPGAPLARVEGRVAVAEMLRRVKNIRLVEEKNTHRYVPSVIQRIPADLYIAFDKADD